MGIRRGHLNQTLMLQAKGLILFVPQIVPPWDIRFCLGRDFARHDKITHRAHAEFAAVGELRRGIVQDNR